jgi:enoyl-CoA hydratase/carnithine racemase
VSDQPVLYREEGKVAFITLNRPDKLNALSPEVFELLEVYITRFAEESDAAVAVLHGNGRSFAAGADIEHYVGIGAIEYLEFMHTGNRVQSKFSECVKPVIAAVQGYALGGGLELALSCDFIVAAPDAQLGLPEVKLGLLPGGGGTQRLPRLIGAMRAAEMIMVAKRISGAQAVDWGMALGVGDHGDALSAAVDFANRLARQAPLPVRLAKVLLRSGAECSLDAAFDLEQSMGAMVFTTDDAREGVQAFIEKRTAEFTGA